MRPIITNRFVKRWWALLALGLLAIVLELFGDSSRVLLRYERAAVQAGEYWRLICGHLVHLGWAHLAMNLAGLALLTALFRAEYRPWQWLTILALSIAFIDAGFLLFEPQLQWYVGLSGVLHGVLAAGAIAYLRKGERGAWILMALLVGKLA